MTVTTLLDFFKGNDSVGLEGLKPGMHIAAHRPLYTHHGIYVGDGQVISYLLETGVTKYSLEEFAEGDRVTIIEHSAEQSFPPEQIVARAEGRKGENNYSLPFNNCEHFANWCVTGNAYSEQVREIALTSVLGAAALAALKQYQNAAKVQTTANTATGAAGTAASVAGLAAGMAVIAGTQYVLNHTEIGHSIKDTVNEAIDTVHDNVRTFVNDLRNQQ